MITSSLDGAIARFDTLNSFPRVLQMMGFDAQESQKAIDKLSEGIDGLPTTLDSVASTAQRIALMTGDLDGAVDTTLALNNAFLASGASTEDAARGLEQYVQMMATGAVDLESWRSLQETMPIALNKTAEAFGYTGRSAQNDLYEALKEGEITFDEFNEKLIELSNSTGGFAEMARESSTGIATSWQNVRTAIVKGLADMIETIDTALADFGGIAGVFDKVKEGVKSAFDTINAAIPVVVEWIQNFKDRIEEWQPTIEQIKEAFSPFVDTVVSSFQNLVDSISPIWESFKQLLTSLEPVLIVIGAAFVTFLAVSSGVFSGIVSAIGPLIEAFIWLLDMVVNVVMSIVALLTGDFSGALDYWKQATESSIEFVKSLWDGIVSFFSGLVETVIDFFHGLYMTLVGNSIIPDMVNAILDWIGNLKDRFIELVTNLVDSVINFFVDLYNNAVDNVKNMVQTVVSKFTEMKDNAINKAQEIVTNVRTKFEEVKTAIKDKITEAKTSLVNRFTEMVTSARDKATEVYNTVRDKFEEVVGAVKEKMDSALDAVKEIGGNIVDFFDGIDLYESGKAIIQSAIDGIKSMKSSISNTVSEIAGKVRGFWPFSPAKEGPLRDIHRMDFGNPIRRSIERAERPVTKAMERLAGVARSEVKPFDIDGRISNLHSQSQRQMSYDFNNELQVMRQPAQITLVLGNNEFEAFVEDINEVNAVNATIRRF